MIQRTDSSWSIMVQSEKVGQLWTLTLWNRSSGIWTGKAQVSLHIRSVWTGPSLHANRIIGYYRYAWMESNGLDDTLRRMIRVCAFCSLRKHAYSNIKKISPPKSENFQVKNSDIFHISAQNIDCGYSLEPHVFVMSCWKANFRFARPKLYLKLGFD